MSGRVGRDRRRRQHAPLVGKRTALAVTLLSPVLLYLVVRAMAVSLAPPAAAALPPRDPAPALRQIALAMADPRVTVPNEIAQTAREAIPASPLAFEPFFITARFEAQQGRLARAIQLLEEARRRRPNFLLTRLYLVALYGEAGRENDMAHELDYALGLSNEAREALVPQLVTMVEDPVKRRGLATLLSRNPVWRRDFIGAAQAAPPSPEAVADLIQRIHALAPSHNLAPERSVYIRALVAHGDARRGRLLWLQTLPQAQRAAYQLVVDPRLTGARAPAPFGWDLHDVDVGRAEILHEGGDGRLEANYFGGRTAVLAEQLIALPAGRYRLATRARSDSGIAAGQISWVVTCLAGNPLTRLPIAAPRAAYRDYSVDFEVPETCAGQRLQLIAEPGDISSPFSAQIEQVEVSGR